MAKKTTRARKARRVPKRAASAKKTPAAGVRGLVAGAVAAVARRIPGTTAEPDALEMLESEHRRFEELLARGEATTERAGKARRALLETLAAALHAHELKEEQVLYPALLPHPEARDIVLEGYEEHHVADLIVAELRGLAADDQQWAAKFKVLKENIEHHIEEEEGEMFRTARGVLSREELRGLARQMLALPRSRTGRTRRSGDSR